MEEKTEKGRKRFTIGVKLDEEIITTSTANNKKEASKVAAEAAIKILHIA